MKILLLPLFLLVLFLLTGCSSKIVQFKKPDIKDDFCGPVMDFKYCKCAFHDEFCDELGISSRSANSYVKNEYNRWVRFKLGKFVKKCKSDGGIFHPKDECEYCELPAIKKGSECVVPEEEGDDEEGDDEEGDEPEDTGFKPIGPFDRDCNFSKEFNSEWKKYSDMDSRIPLGSRSWEAQGVVRTHEQILALKVENFKLKRDMELDRLIRLEARAYKEALVRNIKQNLIKATIRLTYVTYTTIQGGSGAGKSFSTFLTSPNGLVRAGSILSTVKSVIPKDSKLAIDTSTVTGKVANVGIETAYQALEALGNPVDVAIKFMTESKKAVVPSADITPEEINILRDQHITNQFIDHAIAESYKENAKRRAQIKANENKIIELEAEVIAWEAQEKTRVLGMLREACLLQKKKYENK